MKKILVPGVVLIAAAFAALRPAQRPQPGPVEQWVSTSDKAARFARQPETLAFGDTNRGRGPTIVIDEQRRLQSIDGFGFALTGGSAELLTKTTPDTRARLLKEVFSSDGAGVSYLRLTIGASDLNSFVFSYNDLPEGGTDFELKKFSLAQDLNDVVPVMKEILAIRPGIRILASPWSAPKWMKTNNDFRGGALRKECYAVYALYFVKYVQAMKAQGITIDAVTVQNEPLNSKNTPSMQWYVEQQAEFIRDHLGPAFEKHGVATKIVLFDHNLDRPDYPLTLLHDPAVAEYVDGSGFHHYGGEMSAMSLVHAARPDKNLYFTEQMVIEDPKSATTAIAAQVKRLIIGATRNWSRNVVLWNLAADPKDDPHTDNGGCPMCQGAVTIDGSSYSKNLAFYVVAHASKLVPPGSVRIGSTAAGEVAVELTQDEERSGIFRSAAHGNADVPPNVAFTTPGGKTVLIVANDSWDVRSIVIQYRGKYAQARLQPGAVATYVW
jgi:glucosylceramidase